MLEIRKAIENCDFKVGFGTVGNGADDNFTPTDTAMGAYTPNLQYYTNDGSLVGYDTYHLNAPSRNILLNPSYFMPERKYSSADEIEAAILSGNTEFNYPDLLVDDEAFYNYCKVNLAQTLWHELIHSTHIYKFLHPVFACVSRKKGKYGRKSRQLHGLYTGSGFVWPIANGYYWYC